MTADKILRECRRRGIEIRAAGDKVRWRPKDALPPDLRASLIAFKRKILALLAPRPLSARSYAWPWPDTLPSLGPRRVDAFAPCSRCPAWSWVRYGDVALCLADARAELGSGLHALGGLHP